MLRPRFTPGEQTIGTHWIEGWVGPRAGLDAEVRGEILCPCRRSNPGRPVNSWALIELPRLAQSLVAVEKDDNSNVIFLFLFFLLRHLVTLVNMVIMIKATKEPNYGNHINHGNHDNEGKDGNLGDKGNSFIQGINCGNRVIKSLRRIMGNDITEDHPRTSVTLVLPIVGI
jgi:hypothetical protein